MLFTAILLVAVTFVASAQTRKAIGTVVDAEDDEPLIGATVTVVGTPAIGTATDLDGHFTLTNIPAKATKLRISYVGYETAEVNIAPEIQVRLVRTAKQLDEVVIAVPYGTAKKSTFTGAASFVDGKVIEQAQVSNVSKALEGTVAGLQSFASTGQPGSDASIFIRGVGSINADSTPLYVVDGVPYDGSISNISNSDIASVTVLKDAASAALYGSRAANGVIMITTKKGKRDSRPTIELGMKFGFSDRARKDYKQLDTDQYFQLYWEALRNYRLDQGDDSSMAAAYASQNLVGRLGINPYGTAYPQPVGTDGRLVAGATPLWNDDWEDALTKNAHYTDLNVRVSGGSKNSTYYVSGAYLNDQGAYIGSGFTRYNVRTNVVSDLSDWLQLGVNLSASHSVQDYPKQDDSTISNVVLFARNLPPFYPIYERDRTTGEYLLDSEGNRIYDYGAYRASSYANYNLAASVPHDLNKRMRDAATVQAHIMVTPIKNLTYKMTLNVDYNNRTDHSYADPNWNRRSTGYSSKENIRTTGVTWNNVINYEWTLNELNNFHVMAGHEYYEYNNSDWGGQRDNSMVPGFTEPSASSALSDFYGSSDKYKLLSFFGNAEYNYNQRYFLSASVRTDGSSRFDPSKRWGTFFSVGASWRLSHENFMKWAEPTLNNLSIRASYGGQGNDKVGYYAYQALYDMQSNLGSSGLIASRLATPNLTWETNYNFNAAVDFALFNYRLRGSIEYFNRHSKDLLFSRDLVPSSGFESTTENIGAMRNAGWEFQISGNIIQTQDWTWTLSVNATTYTNKITRLPSSEMWSGNKKWVVGGSIYDWWMYEWAGVNPANGNPQWWRTNADGQRVKTEDYSSLVTADKVKLGSSLPDLTGGIQTDLRYRDFTLSALASYSLGGKIYNGDKVSLMGQSSTGSGWSADMLDRWTPENPNTDIPRLTTQPQSSWTQASSRFLVDRSYLRLKTLTFSYNIPENLLSRISFQSASVFLQAENLFTICGQQGLDPEQTVGGTTYYRYPAMRTVSFGLNFKL